MAMASQRTEFLICESCFWCASILRGGTLVGRCPSCKSNMLESIPIGTGEPYRFDCSIRRGVMLDFAPADY